MTGGEVDAPWGAQPPVLRGPVGGGGTQAWVDRLAQAECPALTARRARRSEQSGAPQDPLVWQAAQGCNVRDVEGNIFVDLSAGFGAAVLGHAHPALQAAIQTQSAELVHALGDLHPSTTKIALLERLQALAPWPKARVMLGLSGSDAVEAALKTAQLATGRSGVLAFEGGYHGLSYGALAVSGYSPRFRDPFAAQLHPEVHFAPYPRSEAEVPAALTRLDALWQAAPAPIGAVIVEPIQGRGGVHAAPLAWLQALAERCRARGARLIVDEIMVGLGRTGALCWSAAHGLEADLICWGKALGGGMPVSACVGRADVMAAWGDPAGEAIHTGTFFGHPLGCAAALAVLDVLQRDALPARAAALGAWWRTALTETLTDTAAVTAVRGAGLLLGIELQAPQAALGLHRALLERGYITLVAGADARVLQLLPPLTIPESRLLAFNRTLGSCVSAIEPSRAESR